MAIYHFTWDLEFFGYVAPGLTADGGWKLFARCIASSFLFMAGFSLFLAHAGGVELRPYLKRLGMIVAAAAVITLATFLAVRDGFIFFGILHQIALASVLGLLFIRLPWPVTLVASALFIWAPLALRAPFFDAGPLLWVGLSTVPVRSNDYVPLFPWFGAVLAGIGLAQLLSSAGLLGLLASWRPGAWTRPFTLAGRHSLAIYLIHQPVLIGLVWLFAQIVPPQPLPADAAFSRACTAACGESRDAQFCPRYCGCVFDRLVAEDRLEDAFGEVRNGETESRLNEIATACTIQADSGTDADADGPQDSEGGDPK